MRINIYLPTTFMLKLKAKAKEMEMGTSEYIRYVLTRFWEEK